MLLIDSRLEAAGLEVFRDHADPKTFYLLPGPPRPVLREDGRGGIELLRYRGDEGGGMLFLDVDLAHPEAKRAAALAALRKRFGDDAQLAPILFHEGTARLVALGVDQASLEAGSGEEAPNAGAPRLVARIVGSAKPSLLGNQRAIFSVSLDREGASLVHGALATGDAPLVVAYELAYRGLSPARSAAAQVDYKMACETLRARGSIDTLYFRADVAQAMDSLVQDGLFRMETIDYEGATEEARAAHDEETRALIAAIGERVFFRPAASPEALGAERAAEDPAIFDAWSRSGRAAAAFVLKQGDQEESRTLTVDLRETGVQTARIAPQAALELPEGAKLEDHVRDVTLGEDAAPRVVQAEVCEGAAWEGVAAIVVDVRSLAGSGEVASMTLTKTAPKASVTLPSGGAERRVTALQTDDPEALGAPSQALASPAWAPLETSHLLFDPAALAERRAVTITLGSVDFKVIRAVTGTLSKGGASRAIALDEATKEVVVPVLGAGDATLDVTFHDASGQAFSRSRTITAQETTAVINQPAGAYHVVTVRLQDPLDRYEALFVEIESEAGEGRRVIALSAASPDGSWSMPVAEGGSRRFRARVRRVRRDGSIVEGDFETRSGMQLAVGDTEVRVDPIEIVLIGAKDHLGALVRVTSLSPPEGVDPVVEVLLDPPATRFSARVPFAKGVARHYRVEGQVFTSEGETALGPLEDWAELLPLVV